MSYFNFLKSYPVDNLISLSKNTFKLSHCQKRPYLLLGHKKIYSTMSNVDLGIKRLTPYIQHVKRGIITKNDLNNLYQFKIEDFVAGYILPK